MKTTRLLYLVMAGLFVALAAKAQMSDPRERFNIAATVIGGTNSNYTWEMPSGAYVADGRSKQDVVVHVRSSVQLAKIKALSVSLSPFYNFSSQRLDTEWGGAPLAFTLPSTHHHYGASLMLNYQLKAFGKPLTLMGMGTGNFSQYGYENASGFLGGMFTLTRSRQTYLGLGAIFLLGTAVVWPLYPMIVYSHRFNDHWSINCLGVNNYLYYHVSPTVKYSLGMELETNKYYFRPDVEGLPEKAQVSQLAERVGVFADWQTSKNISLNMGVGVTVPFYCRLQESGYNESYMNLKGRVKPFVSLKAKYSINITSGGTKR